MEILFLVFFILPLCLYLLYASLPTSVITFVLYRLFKVSRKVSLSGMFVFIHFSTWFLIDAVGIYLSLFLPRKWIELPSQGGSATFSGWLSIISEPTYFFSLVPLGLLVKTLLYILIFPIFAIREKFSVFLKMGMMAFTVQFLFAGFLCYLTFDDKTKTSVGEKEFSNIVVFQGWQCQPREGDTYPGGLSSGTTSGSFFGSGGVTESCTAKYPNLSVGERGSKCEADLLKEGKAYADYVVKIWQPKGEAVSKGEQNKEMVCQFLDPASNTIAAKFNYKFTGKKK